MSGKKSYDELKFDLYYANEQIKEIERLNGALQTHEILLKSNLLEIERLNNIINELEKWLEDMSNLTTLHISIITCFTMCLNKLQELKGSVNNDD